ncbi:MAG: plasmid maintenance system killer protein [Sphingobacteriales bacterium]|nr:MAG: plasmid maintenance system killer protein [Sphingobacteriales bacterium]
MDIEFKDEELQDLYEGRKIRNKKLLSNQQLVKQYIKTVNTLRALSQFEEIYKFAGLNYEALQGNYQGFSSVRINQQYRLIFEEIREDIEPFQVKIIAITEISNHYS